MERRNKGKETKEGEEQQVLVQKITQWRSKKKKVKRKKRRRRKINQSLRDTEYAGNSKSKETGNIANLREQKKKN